MSEGTTYPWTIAADLGGSARHGYQGIEIWLNKVAGNGAPYDQLPDAELAPSIVQDLAQSLARAGLQAVSVVCAGALTEPDEDAWRERVNHLGFAVRFAADIGASCVLVVPGGFRGMWRRGAVG